MARSDALEGALPRDGFAVVRAAALDHPWWRDPYLYLVAVGALLLGLPFLRYVSWLGDEGTWLHGAERMLRGEGLHAGFFRWFPGVYFIVAAWMKVVGDGLVSMRVLAVMSMSGVACAIYSACRVTSRSRVVAAGCALAWALMSHGPWTVITHHWLSALFATSSVLASLLAASAGASARRGQERALIVAAALAGAAGMVTATAGVVAVVALAGAAFPMDASDASDARDRSDRRTQGRRAHARRALRLILAGAIVPALCLGAMLASGALSLSAMRDSGSNLGRFSGMQGVEFGAGFDDRNHPLVWLFPALLLSTLALLAIRRREALRDRTLRVAMLAAMGAFISCFPRADVAHVSFRAPMALPLLAIVIAAAIDGGTKPATGATRGAEAIEARTLSPRVMAVLFACASAAVLFRCARAYGSLASYVMSLERTEVARGSVALGPETSPQELIPLVARIAALPAQDRFFFYPYAPMLPYLLDRRHVAEVDIFAPGHTSPRQYAESCHAMIDGAQWVVLDTLWADPAYVKRAFPALEDASPEETRAFETAIAAGYETTNGHGRFQLMRRRAGATGDLCAASDALAR